jgi:HK97 family phage major capsid protein
MTYIGQQPHSQPVENHWGAAEKAVDIAKLNKKIRGNAPEVQMYEKEKEIIAQLTEKITGLNNKARREGRSLTTVEAGLVSEMTQEVERRKLELPIGPLTLTSTLGDGYGSRAGNPFASAGDQYRAIAQAGRPGGQTDQRLFDVRTTLGASETVPSDGGFLLQTDYTNDILQNIYAPGKIAGLCRRIQLSGNANSIKINGIDETSRATGSRWGGARSYWIGEGADITLSKPKFRQLELNLKKQAVLIYCTDEMLQDSTVLESVLNRIASDELSFVLEDVILNGSGAGQPLGILNAGGLVTVTKEVGQKADTLVLENVLKMWTRMIGSSRSNAVWVVNQSVEQQLYSMSLSVGTGGAPVFMPAGGASAAPYMTLLGRPVIPSEHCPELGDLGDIILADFGAGYILAEKGGIQSAMSIHVQFVSDQSVFRFIMRVDGQPVLSTPIVPFKGTALTQSHFVALEARA